MKTMFGRSEAASARRMAENTHDDARIACRSLVYISILYWEGCISKYAAGCALKLTQLSYRVD